MNLPVGPIGVDDGGDTMIYMQAKDGQHVIILEPGEL